MPEVTTLVIAGGAWTALLVVACALCAAASRGEGPRPGRRTQVIEPRGAVPTVVADTGGIRARLRAAVGIIDAEQLTVTVDVGGTEAVLASSRPVMLAAAGDRPAIEVPVRLGGRTVATLRAIRAPGARPFDDSDRVALMGLAARVSSSMEAAREAPADRPTALA